MPVIANGTFSTKGEFPWQVALYQNRNNICGGILLHERLILTGNPKTVILKYKAKF